MRITSLLPIVGVLFFVGCDRGVHPSAVEKSRFSEYGLAFDYPQDLSVETMDGPVRLISIESSEDTRLMISIYTSQTLLPDQVQTRAVDSFRKTATREDETKTLAESVSQKLIAGELRNGLTFQDSKEGKQRITQFYTFAFTGGVVSVLLQNTAEAKDKAELIFNLVLGSMVAEDNELNE